ncbi:MAG: hypothetical protein A2Y38_07280 [Spirochaetes bacterium GWB1_59_5]|nr:MAG: hypothetical protein A2Y38_07280 [Spirochaetes bacterium GWB1_59_5]
MPPRKATYQTQLGGMTYQQIAAVLGVSHTRVQQIEAAALAKVRRALGGMDLIPDDPHAAWVEPMH